MEIELKSDQVPAPKTEGSRLPDDDELTEEKMRRALGLSGPSRQGTLTIPASPFRPTAATRTSAPGPAGQRTEVADGAAFRTSAALPLQERVAELEHQLATERELHAEARRLLQGAELAVRSREANLQQEALAQEEELDRLRRSTISMQRTLDDALFDARQRKVAKRSGVAKTQVAVSQVTEGADSEASVPSELSEAAPTPPVSEPLPPKKRGRPRTRQLPEPAPVRWWTPSYRAKPKG